MKDNLNNAWNMERVFKNSLMEIFIKETMPMENLVDLESIIGRMEVILKVCSKTD